MTLATRALPVRELAAQLSRPVATRSLLPLPRSTISRRSYSIGDKSKEKEPGGQRQLIMAACLAIPVFGVLWLRGSKEDISGAGHGANQEYKESSEGNK